MLDPSRPFTTKETPPPSPSALSRPPSLPVQSRTPNPTQRAKGNTKGRRVFRATNALEYCDMQQKYILIVLAAPTGIVRANQSCKYGTSPVISRSCTWRSHFLARIDPKAGRKEEESADGREEKKSSGSINHALDLSNVFPIWILISSHSISLSIGGKSKGYNKSKRRNDVLIYIYHHPAAHRLTCLSQSFVIKGNKVHRARSHLSSPLPPAPVFCHLGSHICSPASLICLFSGNITAECLGLQPVKDHQDTVAGYEEVSSVRKMSSWARL